MKPPKWRYRTADESRQPEYLAKRFKAYMRLQQMKAAHEQAAAAKIAADEAALLAEQENKVQPLRKAK